MLAVEEILTDRDMDVEPICQHEALLTPIGSDLEGSTPEKLPLDTVIVFDWDDTLLASSFLTSKGLRLDSPLDLTEEMALQLSQLETAVIDVLSAAIKFGTTCIITNAETGWVQLSAQKYIPGVLPLLNQVHVISARSSFEERFPENPQQWKYQAFQSKMSQCFPSDLRVMKNILSFGDSHVEREAVHAVGAELSDIQTKSVKFVERPTLEQLRRQIELVTSCFQFICDYDGNLDLMLTISLFN